MASSEFLRLYDSQERTRTDGLAPGFRTEWDGPVLRMVGPDREPSSNAVLFAALDGRSADGAIARQVAYFAAEGRAFEWKHFSHDEPADLPARLRAAGFRPEERETFVALDLDRRLPLAPTEGLDLRRLEDPASFGVIEVVNEAVYGNAAHAAWLARVVADEKRSEPDSLVLYAAFEGDSPVSVGWLRHRPGSLFGGLWGGSTVVRSRGRGIYSALVAARAAEARRRGCRWLTVDCSPMSLPIVERCGFERRAVITPFIWSG